MLQVLSRQFKGWVVAIALALSTSLLSPTAAQAAIAVSLDSSNATVNVASIYKVNKAERATVLSKVVQSSQFLKLYSVDNSPSSYHSPQL
jgi:hypothetical protein